MAHFLKRLAAVLIVIGLPLGAMATPFSVQLAKSGFTPEDLDLMAATEARLYTPNIQKTGSRLSWSNPGSGASGSVTLESVQGACVELHHLAHKKDRPAPVELRRRKCRADDGRWLLAP